MCIYKLIYFSLPFMLFFLYEITFIFNMHYPTVTVLIFFINDEFDNFLLLYHVLQCKRLLSFLILQKSLPSL